MTYNPRFPEGFLWGASTSSHQVEGGNRHNDWWEAEQSNRVPHASGAACRHFELFAEDFDLARSWGHNAHRFSVEWSRLQPRPDYWESAALDHYVEVVDALRKRELEPIVTLHHFTNPAWFARRGGWTRKDAPRLFNEYVFRVVRALGHRVRFWVTINEPTIYLKQGYLSGEWPPFRVRKWGEAFAAMRNLAKAHRLAYRTIHAERPDAFVSFAHNSPVIEPCRADSLSDRAAAAVRDWVLNRMFFKLGKQAYDFIGLNYYTRTVVKSRGGFTTRVLGAVCHSHLHASQGPISQTGWEAYPEGLALVLRRFQKFGLPLMITENGIATDDEDLRLEFIRRHLEVVETALESGIEVIGYLYWTLMDNFEWSHGRNARFGLSAVDFETQRRIPRPCVEYMSRVLPRNSCRDVVRHFS
ncbi:MAG TPA: family 1 glycosylhydrolase [Acidobacteriota bacterium]|nr:family 1 glycosylhydrolase [Acidobacteriota bacterium]